MKVILIMSLGMIIGFIAKSNVKLIKISDKLCGLVMFVLLFSLGISVGKNDKIMSNISDFGLISFVIAIFACAGSVFFCVYSI